jgi:hypothetical protein
MVPCTHCRDHLLDFVYGLMEEPEEQDMRAHLAVCPDCQQGLRAAQVQQSLLARAAQPIRAVAEFAPPLEAPPARRRRVLRPLPTWTAAAAAVMLAVGGGMLYRQAGLERELADARQRVEEVAALDAARPAQAAAEQARAIHRIEAEALQLHVLGPAQLHPAAGSVLHVTTHDGAGKPASAQVTARLLSGADNKVLYEATVPTEGETRLALPPVAPAGAASARLVVEAHTETAQARVEEALSSSPPTLVAQLETNQSQYRVGETLYFRALALERYGQTPAAPPVPLRAALVERGGTVVAQVTGQADAAGVFAGQLPLAAQLNAGQYQLRVQAAAPHVPLAAQEQPLEIVRELGPALQLDKEQYRPGEQVNVIVNRQGLGKVKPRVTVDDQAVPLQMQMPAQGPAAGMAGGALQARQRNQLGLVEPGLQFQFPLPKKLDNNFANVEVQLDNGKKKETLRRKIAIGAPRLTVDFFPEGGALVAGLPSRIYYRVRSSAAEADRLDGHLVLRGGAVKIDSAFQRGVGSFVLTPVQPESYSVQLHSAGESTTIVDPFRQLGIEPDGIVLHMPDSVGMEGEPLRIVVRSHGAVRRLLLLAECRGQLVEEQWVETGAGETAVELRPAAGAHGVLRITAYEAREGSWRPLAERLAYRAPAQRLQLQIAPALATYRPGQTVHWDILARDEAGKPTTAWILAAVVDENHLPSGAHDFSGGLPSLANLEDATLAVPDTALARQQLDLVLGTHGWRRRASADLPALTRLEEEKAARGSASAAAPALFFSKENASLTELQRQMRQRMDSALERLQARSAEQQREGTARLQAALAAVAAARKGLEAIRDVPRLALAGLGCALLGTGAAVLLAIGLTRLRRGPLPAVAGALACLLLGAGLSISVIMVRPTVAPHEEQARVPNLPNERKRNDALPERAQAEAFPLAGSFAGSPSPVAKGRSMLRKGAEDSVAGKVAPQALALRRGTNLAQAPARVAGAAPALRNMPVPASAGLALPRSDSSHDRRLSAGLPSDTLLWLPALFLEHGTAKISFTLPQGAARYRVLLLGHSAHGRFGFYETRLQVSPSP